MNPDVCETFLPLHCSTIITQKYKLGYFELHGATNKPLDLLYVFTHLAVR